MHQSLKWPRQASRADGSRARHPRPASLALEQLEDRLLPSFAPALNYDTGGTPAGLAVGDLRHSGHLDAVVTLPAANAVSVLLGNDNGTFQRSGSFPTGPHPSAVALADFDGDGNPDIVTANDDGTLSLLRGNGDGTFQPHREVAAGGAVSALAVADLNGDGKPDLVLTDPLANQAVVLLGNGDGTFQRPQAYAVGSFPDAVAVADFNGDGVPDLAVANQNDNTVSVLLGNGDGSFQPALSLPTGAAPSGVAAADLNGDGRPDLVVATSGDNSVSVFLGNGDGTFQDPQTYAVGNRPSAVAVGYFNDDAVPDVAVANKYDNSVSVLLGTGDGTLRAPDTYGVGLFPAGLAVADVNRDGAYDLVTANALSNNLSVLVNQELPQAAQLALSAPAGTPAGPASVTVRAVSAFGTNAGGYGGTVHFTCSDPTATLPADYTFTPADRGVHTFPVTLRTAGPTTLDAVDTANPLLEGGPVQVNVTPNVATTFAIAGIPASFVAGTPISNLTVTAKDAYGNTVPGYRGTVHWTSSDPQAGLTGDYTFTPADNGVHTFLGPFVLRTAGAQWVRVSDTANPPASGTASFMVLPDVASSFVLSVSPGTLTAGVPGTLTLTARDLYGNTATSYRGTVHFTSSDPQAMLPPDYPFTAADNGVHSWGLTLKTAGSQWVRATDMANPSLTGTGTVAVVANVAATFDLQGIPSSVTLGAPTSVTVVARDAYGNTATGYRGTVHFTSSDPRAALPPDYAFTANDQGAHTFSFIMGSPNSQSITANDVGNPAVHGTAPVNVVVDPNRVTRLIVTGIPPHLHFHVPYGTDPLLGFSVTAANYYGETVPGYRGTVRFSTSDGVGGLPETYAFQPADNGTHHFDATLYDSGGQWINVVDTSNPTIAGTVTFGVTIDYIGGPPGDAPGNASSQAGHKAGRLVIAPAPAVAVTGVAETAATGGVVDTTTPASLARKAVPPPVAATPVDGFSAQARRGGPGLALPRARPQAAAPTARRREDVVPTDNPAWVEAVLLLLKHRGVGESASAS
jgi:hypothetical protein